MSIPWHLITTKAHASAMRKRPLNEQLQCASDAVDSAADQREAAIDAMLEADRGYKTALEIWGRIHDLIIEEAKPTPAGMQ